MVWQHIAVTTTGTGLLERYYDRCAIACIFNLGEACSTSQVALF